MFARLSGFGKLGVIHDTVGQALPVGAWSDARNMRFDGVEMQKMLEPGQLLGWVREEEPKWLQLWADGLSTYAAIATENDLYFHIDNGVDDPGAGGGGGGAAATGPDENMLTILESGLFNGSFTIDGDGLGFDNPTTDWDAGYCRRAYAFPGGQIGTGRARDGSGKSKFAVGIKARNAYTALSSCQIGFTSNPTVDLNTLLGGSAVEWAISQDGFKRNNGTNTAVTGLEWDQVDDEAILLLDIDAGTVDAIINGGPVLNLFTGLNINSIYIPCFAAYDGTARVSFTGEGLTNTTLPTDYVWWDGDGTGYGLEEIAHAGNQQQVTNNQQTVDSGGTQPTFRKSKVDCPDVDFVVSTIILDRTFDGDCYIGLDAPTGWEAGNYVKFRDNGTVFHVGATIDAAQAIGWDTGDVVSMICKQGPTNTEIWIAVNGVVGGTGDPVAGTNPWAVIPKETWRITQEMDNSAGSKRQSMNFGSKQPYTWTGFQDGLVAAAPGDSWESASRAGGYSDGGCWQSFAWGDTCIFNNGIDAPQIFNMSTLQFEDLPNWGLISSADDILNSNPPSRDRSPSCTVMFPLKGFLVACGITEGGRYQANKIWWSDVTTLATYVVTNDGAGPPSWDYESPATLSGQIEVDPQSGAIRTAALLNENGIIYTDAAATALTIVGGQAVMATRRLFNKGAASLHSVAEFNNQHFVVSRDQVYIHDGSTVALIAKDRVEEEFFKRIGKGGRFGNGTVDWKALQVVKNPERKEILVNFTQEDLTRTALVWNFEDNNYTWMDASVIDDPDLDPVICMAYGFTPGWQTRYTDQLSKSVTYAEELAGTDPWGDGSTPTSYADLFFAGTEQNMHWLTADGIFEADQGIDTSGIKAYYAERTHMDLDDIVEDWASNSYKHMDQLYFLLQSPGDTTENPNNFDFTPGVANNLMDTPTWKPTVTVNLQTTANSGRHKVDFRATGRYLAMRYDFSATQEIAMTGGDLSVEEAYGR